MVFKANASMYATNSFFLILLLLFYSVWPRSVLEFFWQQYLSTTFGRAKVSKSVGILSFLRKNMLVACPKNEVNFIGPRSYIHRPTKLYSSAYEVNFIFYPTFEASSHGMGRWAVGRRKRACSYGTLHPEAIPRPSRRIAGWVSGLAKESRRGFSLRLTPFFAHPALSFRLSSLIYK